MPQLDDKAQTQVLEFDNFMLVNLYYPAPKPQFQNIEFIMNVWHKKVSLFLKQVRSDSSKPLIICGDFNIIMSKIDTSSK
ncbi:exodeoxyribonuclease iii [Stylonychia lemnae]|uniref:Exodeoxyribonuclease iii n=1 Tax=Stylonychia lemnae TaxID=5949 RepID=A0A078B8R7_STYLE|nr:exodeoxyribonuclease iii [Stylonychia lemnae]|eukprot:CDW90880.1 exodeoxyribonuclease iii [Stylonychia lemnae]